MIGTRSEGERRTSESARSESVGFFTAQEASGAMLIGEQCDVELQLPPPPPLPPLPTPNYEKKRSE